MNINKVSLSVSAVSSRQYPTNPIAEVAFAGRSNVGKSSMINCLLNRNNFARVSSQPGKTATINFYNIDNAIHLVDLPGYGFASASKKEIEMWGQMIEEYLHIRDNLCNVILLVDARHKPMESDITMIEWVRNYFDQAIVVATKCDKLKKTQLEKNLEVIKTNLKITDNDIFIPFSSQTKLGRADLWSTIIELVGYEGELIGAQL